MLLSLIVAMDRNRVIGKDNQLPWHLPEDLKRFKRLTMGKPIIMGRKTHESIGKPLPGRVNIVVSRNPAYRADGCTVVHSLEQAFQAAGDVEEIIVIGGAALYEAALPTAGRLYLTRVETEVEGDTWFPEFDEAAWQEIERDEFPADDKHAFAHTFQVMAKIS